MKHRTDPGLQHPADARGFTLIEVLLAIALTAVVLTLVLQIYSVNLRARREVRALGEPMTTGPRILDMIEDDLRALWTFNIEDGRVLKGESRDIAGYESDRLHMLVGGRTVYPVRQHDDSYRRAGIAEVSYLVKASPDPDLFELWRREDPLVDDDMTKGGGYSLLTNRLRGKEGFRITYYEVIGKEAEELGDWDSAESKRLPRRIRIEFAIERDGSTHGILDGPELDEVGGRVLHYHRDIVIDQERTLALTPGVALLPKIPDGPPELETAQAGGGGGAMAGGAPGAGGRSGAPGDAGGRGAPPGAQPGARPGGQPGLPGLPGAGQPPGNVGDLIRNLGGRAGSGSGGGGGGGGGR